jgi:hypothetical protein
LNVKKGKKLVKKRKNKASLGCGLGQQFAFIKNRVKKYEWTVIYLFFTISNAKNLTCISNNQKCKSKHCCKIETQISLAV